MSASPRETGCDEQRLQSQSDALTELTAQHADVTRFDERLRTILAASARTLQVERLSTFDAATDPRTRDFLETYLTPAGIGAMLDVPLRQNQVAVGVLCAEHVGGARTWTVDEQNCRDLRGQPDRRGRSPRRAP